MIITRMQVHAMRNEIKGNKWGGGGYLLHPKEKSGSLISHIGIPVTILVASSSIISTHTYVMHYVRGQYHYTLL